MIAWGRTGVRTVSVDKLQRYRKETFRLRRANRVQNRAEALAYVNERGFVYFWPIKGIELPSLWTAVAGNRPVADAHDDPGHITWRWKDEMLGARRWYYAKVLRGKATMIALDIVPYFYALSENFGDPAADYLQLYADGLLSREAKTIYEALLAEGPLDTVNLRRKIHMTGKNSNSPFERGLVALQRDFKILPVGIAEAGAWRYSFVYDLVHRTYPDLPEAARPITRRQAQQKLTSLYFASLGAATAAEVRKLFQWRPAEVSRTLQQLVDGGLLYDSCQLPGRKEATFALPEVVEEA
jgi:hypothetical protein